MLAVENKTASPLVVADPEQLRLVPFDYLSESGVFRVSARQHSPYKVDGAFRRAALRARSATAAAFFYGLASAKTERFGNFGEERTVLLFGQASSLRTAAMDLAHLLDAEGLPPGTRMLLPVRQADTWRTVRAWLALLDPTPADAGPLYQYLRPSIEWFDENPQSLQHIAVARGFEQQPIESVERLLQEALKMA